MTRLRRPVAVLLLACALAVLVPPSPSRAALIGLIPHAVRIAAPHAGRLLVRAASWSRAHLGLSTVVGTGIAFKDKIIGATKQAVVKAGDLWNWIKKHPGDAAEIGGAVAGLVDALTDSGMPLTAQAVGHALGTGGNTNPANLGVGDKYTTPECGTMEVVNSRTSDSCILPKDLVNTCEVIFVYTVVEDKCQGVSINGQPVPWLRVTRFDLKKSSTPDDQNIPIPDNLTDAQAQRLLDKIEQYLNSHKEQMESELDELLKKNLNDIDWPKFDADEAKKYLSEHQANKINSKLDELKQELQDELNKPDCQNESDKCNSNTCCNTCKVVELQREIRRLEEKADDQADKEMKEQLDESYDAPYIEVPELKSIDFQPIVDLKDRTLSKFPFNMLLVIPASLALLTADPVAPYFDIDLGIGGQHRIDFSIFDGLASFIRSVLTFLIYLGSVFCCLKIWSRF